ncbi:MAG: homocysteine S-methyltransferase family protein [Clostridiales Family XIII bacterium]|jgi:5-methyltetrahydrofolate--homocysteine methyltransferase|nr:homocysteine S-methyltransferase family protein [Clostridiales Family XIII bacterium]
MKILDFIKERPLILDGAMGTSLQAAGLEAGENPELYNVEKPKIVEKIYEGFIAAGSNAITTNTFGANRFKLGDRVADIITAAVKLAREKDKGVFIIHDIGPSGKLMKPAFEMSFDQAYDIYKEQILAGKNAGADAHLFETFTDIGEIRAGIIAAKENSNLPIFASLTFGEDGRMLLGTNPKTAVYILQDLGIDAIGLNCSLGPMEIIPVFEEIIKYSKLPVLVQPNSGMPKIVNGLTVFPATVEEYKRAMKIMLKKGARILGGCCGTDTRHIEVLRKLVDSYVLPIGKPKGYAMEKSPTACSSIKTVVLGEKTNIIGERINPTGKKILAKALINKDYEYIAKEAIKQERAGAKIININLGIPDIDEEKLFLTLLEFISRKVNAPLMIDSKNIRAIENAVRKFSGKLIINSVTGEKESLKKILPISKKYGNPMIALLLDDKGVPKTVKQRLKILDKIIREAEKIGIERERLIVDALALTVSTEQKQVEETLETIKIITEKYGLRTTLGASNISFGLPMRSIMNANFLAIARYMGLSTPITDPTILEYRKALFAAGVLAGIDKNAKDYINFINKNDEELEEESLKKISLNTKKNTAIKDKTKIIPLVTAITEGLSDDAKKLAKLELKTQSSVEIIDKIIVPSLEKIGKDYESGKIFLPQMISASNTAKKVFEVLEASTDKVAMKKSNTVILATVKGDVHDIGKNIVSSLLGNYGFNVVDLGKDVNEKTIVSAVKKEKAKALFLSALMTTTMVYMEDVIKELRINKLTDVKVAVGGAVVTQGYADKIGADYYAKDAIGAVKIAKEIFSKKKK